MRRSVFCFIASICSFAYFTAYSQLSEVNHWETIIYPDHVWKYLPGTTPPPADWKDLHFDDSQWSEGPGGIGYGDGDDQTVIGPVISLYLRKTFSIADSSRIAFIVLHMDYDDAFVAYLNGNEVARANIGGSDPAYDAVSTGDHEAIMYSGGLPEEFSIPPELFKQVLYNGENILAIQVHNRAQNSSDMTALPFLSVGMRDSAITYLPPPDWFIPPIDYSISELPIISINTLGNVIQDEPRIKAAMGIIDKGPGKLNSINDSITGYNGWISIEIRGESAQMFPKKSYSFETQDSLGNNNNVSLLGLPVENDWILYGPYSDKTLIKNVLSYRLSRDLGRYASRTSYVELYINRDYKGLYVLMEKIKRDRNRIDIASLTPLDVEGDQLTGGYILRVDKVDPNDYPAWVAYPDPGIPNEHPVTLQFFDPTGQELLAVQQSYIQNFIRQFEASLNSTSYLHSETGFHRYIDKDALIDFLIVNEIAKNIDAYIFSTYLYKNRDSEGGKLTFGPVWDFNIAYGNVDYNEFVKGTSGWVYNEGYRMYWFRRMMNDWGLKMRMSCRWHELRANEFSDVHIMNFIDSLVNALQNPINKNFKRWPVLGEYVWPNSFIGNTHAQEINYLKNWLQQRLNWMDANIPETCITGISNNLSELHYLNVYPNPFTDHVVFDINGNEAAITHISIRDPLGRYIKDFSGKELSNSPLIWNGSDHSGNSVSSGLYIIKIKWTDGNWSNYKILKN